VSSTRHLVIAGAIWAVLSVIGVVVVMGWQIIPVIASNEAAIENEAFVLLTAVSVPVLMFVVVGLVYSALRFRATDDGVEGPRVHGHQGIQIAWVLISFVMVIGLFVYGSVGLINIRGSQNSDFEVNVRAEQWAWHYEYPSNGAKSDELHIPVGRRVHLSLMSDDVIHSLWVPALGVKQDVVPGHPTDIYVSPTTTGTFPAMCAELCGLGHTTMTTTVVISSDADLAAWLADNAPAPEEGSPTP
jgi:cytochrome c oxidase subunit II